MPTVVDDATLLAVLARQAEANLQAAAEAGNVLTTSSWYYRLSRALHDPQSTGQLTRMAADLGSEARERLLAVVDDLPEEIAVLSARRLVPVMSAIRVSHRVNYLATEALATALLSDGGIRIATDSPGLRRACDELDIRLELRPPLS